MGDFDSFTSVHKSSVCEAFAPFESSLVKTRLGPPRAGPVDPRLPLTFASDLLPVPNARPSTTRTSSDNVNDIRLVASETLLVIECEKDMAKLYARFH